MINPSINDQSISHQYPITHIIINTTYINSTHFNHTATRLLQRVTDQRSSLGFSLSLNDCRLRLARPLQPHNLLLLRTRHHELGLLRTLQRHLLLLNGVVEVASERQMRDRHIVQLDVVLLLVDGGERAVIFDRFRGVLPKTIKEGTHFKIPFIQVEKGREA